MPFSTKQRFDLISKARRSVASAVIGRRVEPGSRKRKPRIVPYKQDARDGNNNQIVQEGTIFERPEGTDIVDGRIVPRSGGRKVTVTQTKPKKTKKPTAKQQEKITAEQRQSAIEDLLQREREQRISVVEASLGSIDPDTKQPWTPDAKRAAAEREVDAIPSSVRARLTNSDLETRRLRSRAAQIKKKYRLKNVSVERILSDEKISQDDRDAFARDLLAFFSATPYVTGTKSGKSRGFTDVVGWAQARARGFASDNPEMTRSGLVDEAVGMAMALTAAKVLSDRSRLSAMSGRHHSDFLDYLKSGAWRDKGSKTLRDSATGATGLSDIDDALEAFSHRALLDTTQKLREARSGRLREGRVKRTKQEREQQRDFIYKSIQKLAEDGSMSEVEKATQRERLITNMDQDDAVFTAMTMVSTAKPDAIYPRPRQRKMSAEQESLAYGMRQMLMSIMPEQVHVEVPAIDRDGKTIIGEDGRAKAVTRRVDLKSSDLSDLSPLQLHTLIAAAAGLSDEEALELLPPMDKKGTRMQPTAYRKNKQTAREKLSARLMNRGMADSEAEVDDAARQRMLDQQRRDQERREFYADEYNRYARAVNNYRAGREEAAREMLAEIRAADTAIEEASSRIDREDANSDELKSLLKRAVWSRAGAERDLLLLERERLVTDLRESAPYLLSGDSKEIARRRSAARNASQQLIDEINDIEFEISVRRKRNSEFAEEVDRTGKRPSGKKGKSQEITLPSGKTKTIPPYTDNDEMRSLQTSLTSATRKHNQNFSVIDSEGAMTAVDARAVAKLRRVHQIEREVNRLNDEFGHVIGEFTEVPMYDGSDEDGPLAGRDLARVTLSDLRDIPVRVNTISIQSPRTGTGSASVSKPTVGGIIAGYYQDHRTRIRAAASLLPSDLSDSDRDGYQRLAESMKRHLGLREHLDSLYSMGLEDGDDQVVAIQMKIKDIENGEDGKKLARQLGIGDGKRMPDSEDLSMAVTDMRAARIGQQPAASEPQRRKGKKPVVSDVRDMPIPTARRELDRNNKQQRSLIQERDRLERENINLAIMANQTGDKKSMKTAVANRERIKQINVELNQRRMRYEEIARHVSRYESRGSLRGSVVSRKKPTKSQVAEQIASTNRQSNRARVAQIGPELNRLRTQRRNELKRLEQIGASTSPKLEQIEQTISSLSDERRTLNRSLKSVQKFDVRSQLRRSMFQ